MLTAAIAYFLLACMLAAWLTFPAVRAGGRARILRWFRRVAISCRHAACGTRDGLRQAIRQARMSARHGATWMQAHWPVAVAVAALLAAPSLVVVMRGCHADTGYADLPIESREDAVVTALLKGEQLIPPPPLPPEVFSTPEVETVRPRLHDADRRWDLLDSDFRQRLLLAYRLMREEHGYDMVLIEGYRTPQRQALLAAMGPQVTNAAAWQSYHQHGLAADSAFLRSGKLVISERDPWARRGYERFGIIAERIGLTWGGRWQNADLGHVELRKPTNVVTPDAARPSSGR